MFSASWPAKAWPAREGAALYRLLLAAGLDPVLVCGPQRRRAGGRNCARRHRKRASRRRPTLRELAHLLSRCAGLRRHRQRSAPPGGLARRADGDGLRSDQTHAAGTRTTRGMLPSRRNVACSPCELMRCPVPGHPLPGRSAGSDGGRGGQRPAGCRIRLAFRLREGLDMKLGTMRDRHRKRLGSAAWVALVLLLRSGWSGPAGAAGFRVGAADRGQDRCRG
jgi:hypothetical protein